MKDTTETQTAQIMNYIYATFNKLNAKQAFKLFGTMKLATRIGEIERNHGLKIEKARIKGTRYMEYWMNSTKKFSV